MKVLTRSYIFCVAFILLACDQSFSAGLENRMEGSRAGAHPLIHEGLLTNPTEGLVIGNGDLAASVQIFSNELKLNLGKNDVWDTRYNSPSKTEEVAVTQDELIAYVEEHGVVSPKFLDKPKKQGEPVVHSPLRVGAIRIAHPGWSGTKARSIVRIDRGTLEAEYQFPSGTLRFTAFIHREKNLVMLRASAEGQGIGGLNIAACHCCALVSETSCEHFNCYLDRGLVAGTIEKPELGYFSFLYNK
ncbi:hypothetical protein F7C95_05640 [Opitutia bacterium ISCC 51]|nr:hypothetical protein F7C95_05640 [Opitutae bacterium ISCC 51]QXD29448.1 hypothetical protein GA003_05610 [Opitutae bacterium ISCC 52]